MEYIKGHDRYLDPPVEPTHWECSKCGVMFDGGDLWQPYKGQDYWLCDECYEEFKKKQAEEAEL